MSREWVVLLLLFHTPILGLQFVLPLPPPPLHHLQKKTSMQYAFPLAHLCPGTQGCWHVKHSLFILSSCFLGHSLFSLVQESFFHGFLPSLKLEGKFGLGGYLVVGNTFCKYLVKFMASFNVVVLWDFTSLIKYSYSPSLNNKTNLAIDTSETITEIFSNSNIYASWVPT